MQRFVQEGSFFVRRTAYLTVMMVFFCSAFYLPLTSKTVNNFFYVAIALPCLLWALARPGALWGLLRSFAWFFVLLLMLVILNAGEMADIKKWLYLFSFFMACVFLGWSNRSGGSFFTLFALVSCGVFLIVLVDWLLIWGRGGSLVRYDALFGERINPVYFSLLISSSLIFLWLFKVEPWLEGRWPKHVRMAGLLVLLALVLLCATVFQSRTTLLGLAFFLGGYALHRRLILSTLLVLGLFGCLAIASGSVDVLLKRGFSYRLDIWHDAWLRLIDVCGIWWGCGADDYRFLGQFYHAHSGYVAMLYRNGLIGAAVFVVIAVMFFWRSGMARSRWLLLALFGWGSLITTTSGVLTSPQPLWIYFWLPTFMAMLEAQKESINHFLASVPVSQRASQ